MYSEHNRLKMKKGMLIVSLFILLCTTCSCHAAFQKTTIINKNASLINKACKASRDYDLCLSVLKEDPRSTTADLQGLTLIVIEHAITKAKKTIDLLHKLDANTTDKPLKICFKGCADTDYPEFIGNCQVAIDYVKQNKPLDAGTKMGNAVECESGCEDCFSETIPPRKSPITVENQLNVRVINIAAYMFACTEPKQPVCDGHSV